jgi:hypothetical protein
MSGYVTTSERVSDIRFCPLFSDRGHDARSFFEAARGQRDIGSNAYVHSPDALGNPVVGCICSVANENHAHVRHARWPDRAGAIRDNENFDLETRRHAVDLLTHRARITIDVNVSQIPACLPAEPATWRIRTAVWGLRPPISQSRTFDHRLRALAPLTAIARAFLCPTSTTRRFPRVTPVQTRFRCSIW